MDVGVDPNTASTGNMEPLTSNVDTNGNDNEADNDNNIEDNINEAASEDSGMSSVDNHNMSGRKMSEKCPLSAVYYIVNTQLRLGRHPCVRKMLDHIVKP